MAGLEEGGGSRTRRALAVASAVAIAVLLAGCGVRWETEPPVFPSPDAVTLERDALAQAEADVADAAAREGAAADPVVAGAAAAAEAHLDVLGGVYVAYPSASPSPEPEPTVSPAPLPTLAETIGAARRTAAGVAETTADADLAFLARSIDLEWALRELWAERKSEEEQREAEAAADAAAATASPEPTPTREGEPADDSPSEATPVWFPLADGTIDIDAGFAPGAGEGVAPTGLSDDVLTELAIAEDQARFAYETLAAQEFGPRREDALDRASLHAERSDAFAAHLEEDPRTPLYQLRDVNLLDPEARRALERTLETDLAWRYAALLDGASAEDAAWLLNASFDAHARAMRTDGFSVADLPSLPGVLQMA